MAKRHIYLGGNPFTRIFEPFLRLVLIGLCVLLLVALILGVAGMIPGIILGTVFLYLFIDMAADVLEALTNVGTYRAALRAARSGRIVPSWVARNSTCSGILLVDETSLTVYVNGHIASFQDVLSVISDGETVRIVLDGDDVPSRNIEMNTRDEAEIVCLKLISVVGIEPITVVSQ